MPGSDDVAMAWIDNYLVGSYYGEANRLASISITVPSGLNNTMLLAMATGRSTWTNPENISGFTWQSAGFTVFNQSAYDYNGEGEYYIYYLLNPTAAGPANVTISYALSRNHDTLCEIHVLKNVTQQAPKSLVIASGTGTTRTNSGISCTIGDLILCQMGCYGSISSPTFGSDQTILTHQYFASTQLSSYLTSWKKAASASESMTQTWVTSRDHRQGSFAIETIPAGANNMILAM